MTAFGRPFRIFHSMSLCWWYADPRNHAPKYRCGIGISRGDARHPRLHIRSSQRPWASRHCFCHSPFSTRFSYSLAKKFSKITEMRRSRGPIHCHTIKTGGGKNTRGVTAGFRRAPQCPVPLNTLDYMQLSTQDCVGSSEELYLFIFADRRAPRTFYSSSIDVASSPTYSSNSANMSWFEYKKTQLICVYIRIRKLLPRGSLEVSARLAAEALSSSSEPGRKVVGRQDCGPNIAMY